MHSFQRLRQLALGRYLDEMPVVTEADLAQTSSPPAPPIEIEEPVKREPVKIFKPEKEPPIDECVRRKCVPLGGFPDLSFYDNLGY